MADNFSAGTAYFRVDGKSFALVGEFSWSPSTPSREGMYGQDGFHGLKSKPRSGTIKAKLRDSSGVSIYGLGSLTSANISVELANGKTVVGSGMFQSGDITAESEDGTIDITFEGPDVREG